MNFPSEEFDSILKEERTAQDFKTVAQRTLPLLDLTRLGDTDSMGDILQLCRNAVTPFGSVAAVCIYSQFVSYAKSELVGTDIKLATVANFPKGDQPVDEVIKEIQSEIIRGADEVDVVLPYTSYLSGETDEARNFLKACREVCGKRVTLKVILETGAFPNAQKIYEASLLAIEAGANFVKTSTGKIKIGATLEAAIAMLLAIRDSEKTVGFKASGGIRTVVQAAEYLSIADRIMGNDWVSSDTFRFGASSLLNDVLHQLES
ncbi:MAG: deoxyribose-phosphate aldolase [Gammaproteobacteria bacterium]|nr:deoxyribose-phosphate aldolase [Gammaproteobacteria bacterium]MBU1558564.1 deoxyribose-phosphate aldolase [Gammaproteobacteria bacterium]MBU1629064.1 deoxyribose-phosphate aldolase [Gammaproteobacteria bacterium]MBU1926276.1 deoxyribose-phosphate aldolase [Gammaproteobacteria bacterium]MBU2546491.1 deoxyribose-phosphate aldolase [Gammaproteobacteria bacterium]